MSDADIEKVAAATVSSSFSNAGQVCISTQRVFAARTIYADLLDALVKPTQEFSVGNPFDEDVKMGPMIRQADAERVETWIAEAVDQGARVIAGGDRQGTLHTATVIADARPEMLISREELFGPAVAVSAFDDIDDAIAKANDTRFGPVRRHLYAERGLGHAVSRWRSIRATCTSTRRPSGAPT